MDDASGLGIKTGLNPKKQGSRSSLPHKLLLPCSFPLLQLMRLLVRLTTSRTLGRAMFGGICPVSLLPSKRTAHRLRLSLWTNKTDNHSKVDAVISYS